MNQSFITGTQGGCGIAVDGAHVYWSNNTAIGRADLAGTNVNQNYVTGSSTPDGLALDATHIYWASRFSNTIGRGPIGGGGGENSFIPGAAQPIGLALGGGNLYWTNFGNGGSGSGCSGIHACVITMSADHVVGATFARIPLPVVKITKTRIDQKKRTASFSFTATGATGFRCALTKQARNHSKPSFSRCASPKTYKHLKAGHYTFRVKAHNHNGTGPTASHKFVIK